MAALSRFRIFRYLSKSLPLLVLQYIRNIRSVSLIIFFVSLLKKHNYLLFRFLTKRSKVKEIIVLIKARSFLDELNLEHLTS